MLFSTGGTFTTTFSLYYNSRNKSVGPLGRGWSHSFSARLFGPTAADANHIYLWSGNGVMTVYTLTNGNFLPPPGDTSSLTRNPDKSAILAYPSGVTYNFDTNGNLVLITDSYGNQTRLEHPNGDLSRLQITDASGRVITLIYDTTLTPHRLTAVLDPAGNTYDLQYQNGLLWRVLNPLADAQAATRGYWEYTYNAKELLETKRDPNGNVSRNAYQNDLRIQTSTDPEGLINPAGHTRSLSYGDPVGSLLTTTLTEKDGTLWTYTYDTQKGLLKSATDPNGKVTKSTYYANNHLKSITGPNDIGKSLTTFYTYDSNGNMLTETDPADLSIYTPAIDPETVTDPSTLAGLTPPIKPAFRYSYDTVHYNRLTSVSDERGTTPLVTTYAYTTENEGDVVTATAPGNLVTVTKYNPNGTVSDKIDGNGKTTHIEYYPVTTANISNGSAGGIKSIVGPDGVKRTYTAYDKNGNPTEFKLTDTNNAEIPVKSTHRYDALNRLVSILKESTIVPARFPANLTQFGYDGAGNRNSLIDAETHETNYEYRYDHQLKKVTNTVNSFPLDTVYEYGSSGCPSCNGVDKLTAVKDPKHVKNNLPGTTYKYDPVGRLQYETDPLGKKIRYEYYDNGLIWKKYDTSGGDPGTLLVTYLYNNRGQITEKQYPGNTSVRFTYKPNGWLETARNMAGATVTFGYTYEYHDNGRLKSVTDSNNRKISYDQYDALGQKKQMTILKGAGSDERVINFDYDAANRPWHIKIDGDTKIFTYAYDERGRRDTLSYPNTTTVDWDFDDLDRLTAITHRVTGGAAFASNSYPLHDQVGNVKEVSGERNSTYFYDEIYRILNVVSGNPEAFTFDDAGNRKTGPGPLDSGFLHNNGNQVTTGRKLQFGYDNRGNQTSKTVPGATDKTWTQTWDNENRLIKAEKIKTLADGTERKTVTFTYDPFGRRIEKNVEMVKYDVAVGQYVTTTENYKYLYDNEDIALEIYTPPIGPQEKTYYTHGPGIDEPLALERGGAFYYYHADGLGSIVKITNAAHGVVQSYEYESFGMATQSTKFRNSLQFTAREYDPETGLLYLRNRYLDLMEGRFISKDLIGFKGGINLYSYVLNNPIKYTDPLGLFNSGGFSPAGPGPQWYPPQCEDKCKTPVMQCVEKCISMLNPWWSTPVSSGAGAIAMGGQGFAIGGAGAAATGWGLGTSLGCFLVCSSNPCYYDF